MQDTARRIHPLAWVLFVALLLRAALIAGAWIATGDTVVYSPDTESYLQPARELIARGTFTTFGEPEVIRTPGYPLLLIPGLLLGHVKAVTLAIHLLLALLSTVGVFAVAREVTGSGRAGLAGALLFALEPASVAFTTYLLTETAASTLLIWAVWLLVRYLGSSRLVHLAGGMALVVASAYVRPVSIYLPACLVAFFVAVTIVTRRRQTLAHAAVAGLVALALVAPWWLRNYVAGFPGFSSAGAINVYFYSAAQVLSRQTGHADQSFRMGWAGGMQWVNDDVYLRLHPEQRTWTRSRRYLYMRHEGRRIVRENFPAYLRIHALGVIYTMLGTAGAEFRHLLGAPVPRVRFVRRIREGSLDALDVAHVFIALFLVFVYVMAAYGLVAGPRNAAQLLVLCVAAYLVFAAAGAGDTRYRVPAMPLICALGGIGLAALQQRRERVPAR